MSSYITTAWINSLKLFASYVCAVQVPWAESAPLLSKSGVLLYSAYAPDAARAAWAFFDNLQSPAAALTQTCSGSALGLLGLAALPRPPGLRARLSFLRVVSYFTRATPLTRLGLARLSWATCRARRLRLLRLAQAGLWACSG
jgi:hypothetical protein